MEKKEEVYLNSDLTVGDFDVFKISKRVILIEKDKHQLLINKGWIPFCQLDKPDKIVYKKMSKIGKTPRIAGLFLTYRNFLYIKHELCHSCGGRNLKKRLFIGFLLLQEGQL